ncbi:hypothetical protein ACFL1E_03915 [Candidatus Omnitrophota bacterium]
MKKQYPLVMGILAVIIAIAFFLPWVSVESAPVSAVSKVLTGSGQAIVDNISAYDVPVLANSSESRLVISIIKIFNPGITNADKKSFLIWAIPLLAVILVVVSHMFGDKKITNLIISVLGVAIFAVALFKLQTTDLNKLVIQINIGIGVWLTLYGYLGMGIASIVNLLPLLKKK